MRPPPGARKGRQKNPAKVKKAKKNQTERTTKKMENKNWRMRKIVSRWAL
jgi:hypothetical protein